MDQRNSTSTEDQEFEKSLVATAALLQLTTFRKPLSHSASLLIAQREAWIGEGNGLVTFPLAI